MSVLHTFEDFGGTPVEADTDAADPTKAALIEQYGDAEGSPAKSAPKADWVAFAAAQNPEVLAEGAEDKPAE